MWSFLSCRTVRTNRSPCRCCVWLSIGSAWRRRPVCTTVIASQEQAQERGFVGSPTILINGVDPFGVAGQSPAYACRVYATPAGLSGVPPLGDIISALTAAGNREPASPE
jgi:hypothetical protein